MDAVLLVPPTDEPVTLAETKAWLRIDADTEDTLIGLLITTARTIVETWTRRVLVTQTWRLTLDAWPQSVVTSPLGTGACVSVPTLSFTIAPVISVATLRVYDMAGVPQVIAPSTYALRGPPDDARLVFMTLPVAPGRSTGGIEADIVAGYGAPNDVPAPLRQAILMLVSRLFENRGDASPPSVENLRGAACTLLAPFRRPRLA